MALQVTNGILEWVDDTWDFDYIIADDVLDVLWRLTVLDGNLILIEEDTEPENNPPLIDTATGEEYVLAVIDGNLYLRKKSPVFDCDVCGLLKEIRLRLMSVEANINELMTEEEEQTSLITSTGKRIKIIA